MAQKELKNLETLTPLHEIRVVCLLFFYCFFRFHSYLINCFVQAYFAKWETSL